MELGQRISVHRGRVSAGGWLWYLAAACLAAGVLGLARGSAQVQTGVAALGIGVVLLIVPILRWRQMVEVFERGFVWTRLLGVVRVARAEIRDATLIRHRSRQGTREEVKVELVSGKAYAIVGAVRRTKVRSTFRSACKVRPKASRWSSFTCTASSRKPASAPSPGEPGSIAA